MINAVERLGDRLLSLVAPRAEAAASCTIATRWVYCGWCLYDPSCGSSYAPNYYHEERLNDCRWYTDIPCSEGWVSGCC